MEDLITRSNSQVDELLASLPACRRCRGNKRRCDTLLPSCYNCAKAGVECIYFDHVLDEDLPRSYISSLITALENVGDQGKAESEAESSVRRRSSRRITTSRDASRYVGRLSCLSQSLVIRGNESLLEPKLFHSLVPIEELEEDLEVKPKMHQFLLQSYFSKIHPLYPILHRNTAFLSPQSFALADLAPSEAFILQMVYSIACQWEPKAGNRLLALSDACHARALNHIDSATANLTIMTLQGITLLALRSLFDPQKGNFGQLIAFAARLAIDIGGQDMPARGEHMQNIHTSIYCMENQFSTALDRPPFLPEPTRPFEFDISQPSEYLCSLYRIQAKYRGGSTTEAHDLMTGPNIDQLALSSEVNPNLLSVFYETKLLLDPNPAIATRLLNTYSHPEYIQTFLTPHWTYRAGLIILEHNSGAPLSAEDMEGYGTCLVILNRAAMRWKGAVALSESIRSYVKLRSERERLVRGL